AKRSHSAGACRFSDGCSDQYRATTSSSRSPSRTQVKGSVCSIAVSRLARWMPLLRRMLSSRLVPGSNTQRRGAAGIMAGLELMSIGIEAGRRQETPQHVVIDGLDEMMVESGLARGLAIDVASPARHRDDRHVCRPRFEAKRACDLEAAAHRQTDVEQHHV